MNSELEAIRDAWDAATGEGRDEPLARQLADAYVAANPDEFVAFSNLTREQVVEQVDIFRAAHQDADVWRVETWLLHKRFSQPVAGGIG